MKRRLKVGFASYSYEALVIRARGICEALKKQLAVEFFPNLNPPLSVLITSTEAFANAVSGESTKVEAALRRQLFDELVDLLKREALYLEDVANGNAVMLAATGYELTVGKGEHSTEPLEQPINVRVERTGFDGQIRMRCKAIKRAQTYQGRYRTSPDGEWITVDPTAKSQWIMFNNLTAGQLYEFQVRAFGANGAGPWSDICVLMAV